MNNIFENAKFGDKFRTRDGKMVIFYIVNGFGVTLLNEFGLEHYHNDGVAYHNSPNEDVVFEWQEPINEEELNKLAKAECLKLVGTQNKNMLSNRNKEHADLHNIYTLMELMYKAGYREAMEGVI